ncbi:MAG: MATE family efflux transporter [Kiritimatiellae bacterium]|nr:MATE family efflux transporter [Kiritimatiellia bacterium]
MTWRERISAYVDVYRLVWPLALGMANNAIMQFVDRVFLSNDSTASLEAVLPASMLALLFVGFFQSIIAYSGTFVAQYFGAGKESGCSTSYKAGLLLSFVFGAVLLCLVPVGNFVFDCVGHSPEVVAREKTYCSIVLFGGFATCGMMAASGYFTGKGHTRLVFWVNLLGNGLNILFDYLFIFGFDSGIAGFGLQPCGIAGAAWATVVAQVTQMLVLNFIAIREIYAKNQDGIPKCDCGDTLRSLTVKLLRYGVPSGVQSMLNILSFVIFVFLTGKVGDLAFAVSNAAFSVNYLLIAPIEGIAVGAGVLVGQHQGAGDPDGAFRAGNRTIVLAEIYVAVASTLVLVFGKELLMLFAGSVPEPQQAEFLSLGYVLFVLMVLWQYCDAADVVLSGALKGAGDTRFVMVWMLIMAFPFWMPILFATYWICPTMTALWSTMVVYVFAFFVGTWIRWVRGPWRKIRLVA